MPCQLYRSKTKNFVAGSFGFHLPGNDEIEISNFGFQAAVVEF